MTNIEQEIIGSDKTIKGSEKIETITPETIEVPNYDYGIAQNTLDAEIVLRNNTGGVYYTDWDDDDGTGTVPYDIVITGVGFKPKMLKITATRAQTGHSVISWGTAREGEKGQCIYQHDNSNTVFSGISYSGLKIISLEWQINSTTYPDIEAELKSFDNDGFTLTVTRNDEGTNFVFLYECYG